MQSIVLTVVLSATLASTNQTQVIDYKPTHMTVARTGFGSCWEGSIAANRSDAFRCMVGNSINDPCFVRTAKSVACPDIPTADRGLVITLTKPLPANDVSGNENPWAMIVTPGTRCRIETGTVVPGFPYYCTESLVCAVPAPDPNTGEYHTACGTAEAGPSGPHVTSRKRYTVTTLWR